MCEGCAELRTELDALQIEYASTKAQANKLELSCQGNHELREEVKRLVARVERLEITSLTPAEALANAVGGQTPTIWRS